MVHYSPTISFRQSTFHNQCVFLFFEIRASNFFSRLFYSYSFSNFVYFTFHISSLNISFFYFNYHTTYNHFDKTLHLLFYFICIIIFIRKYRIFFNLCIFSDLHMHQSGYSIIFIDCFSVKCYLSFTNVVFNLREVYANSINEHLKGFEFDEYSNMMPGYYNLK